MSPRQKLKMARHLTCLEKKRRLSVDFYPIVKNPQTTTFCILPLGILITVRTVLYLSFDSHLWTLSCASSSGVRGTTVRNCTSHYYSPNFGLWQDTVYFRQSSSHSLLLCLAAFCFAFLLVFWAFGAYSLFKLLDYSPENEPFVGV